MEGEPNLEELWKWFKTLDLTNSENMGELAAKMGRAIERLDDKIKDALTYAEKTIVEGKELDFSEKSPLAIYNAMIKNPSPYHHFLQPSLMMLDKIVRSAMKQRKLFEFYETTSDQSDYAIWGLPEKPKVKVFIKEKDDFYIQTIELPLLSIKLDDKTNVAKISGLPLVYESKRAPWKKDYRRLVTLLEKEVQTYSVMLAHYPEPIPRITRMKDTTVFFLEAFFIHRERQQENA
ncbi:MAG: hypothetical protein Q7J54_05530 [Candidatus Woesearchaeota archaeon]|nr:hypothetical protein [Candidatus Woesearchaeota archaeon]